MANERSLLSRYRGCDIVADDGARRLSFRGSPAAADPERCVHHTLVSGETLDLLAARYYGSEALWWAFPVASIASAAATWLLYTKGRWRLRRAAAYAAARHG